LEAPVGTTRAPQSNLEIIWSDWLDAIRRGDIDRLASRVTPSTTHLGVRPDLVCANGQEVVENARSSSDHLPAVEAIEVIGSGDRVVVCVRAPDIGMPAGEDFQGQAFVVFTLRDGKITEIHDYLSRHEALEAADAKDLAAWR
jgi:ketosteroid isomerase-like protein